MGEFIQILFTPSESHTLSAASIGGCGPPQPTISPPRFTARRVFCLRVDPRVKPEGASFSSFAALGQAKLCDPAPATNDQPAALYRPAGFLFGVRVVRRRQAPFVRGGGRKEAYAERCCHLDAGSARP